MPPSPWKKGTTVDPDTEVTVMATYLLLRRHRSIPRFVVWAFRIRRQLAHTEGMVGFSMDANLRTKQFWTASAWTTKPALGRFNRTDPHAGAVARIRPLMAQTVFVDWTAKAGDVPVDWAEAKRRVTEAP